MKIAFLGQMPLKKEVQGVVGLHRSGPFFLRAVFTLFVFSNGLFIVFTVNGLSSPNAFIGDPMFLKKSLDSRSKALRE
jgi:hypothetical protein